MPTREEVTTTLGVDSSSIEKGLGVGRNHFVEYQSWLKTQEGQYSSWWNTELKKREEMEVESSVRAASRSIQARKLLRERAAAREAAENAAQSEANTIIGAGSIPEGMAREGRLRQEAIELEKKAAAAMKDVEKGAHGSAGAFREFLVMVREAARGDLTRLGGSLSKFVTMLGLSTAGLAGLTAAIAEAGAIVYFALSTRKAVKEEEKSETRLDKGAEMIAGRLKGEISNLVKAHTISKETADKYDKILSSPTMERNRIVQDALRKLGGPISKHDAAEEARLDQEHYQNLIELNRHEQGATEKLTMDLFRMRELKGEMAKLDRTSLEYKQKQIELDHAEKDMIEDKKKLEQEQAEAARKQREEESIFQQAKLRMADIEQRQRESFMPTLEELAHHGGKFSAQAFGIEMLDRKIKRDFEQGNIKRAQSEIDQRNKLYDSLADRGVVAERADRREIKELSAKMELHLANIASGKTAVLVTPKMAN